MAKKKQTPPREYEVLTGFNASDESRWEIGDPLKDGDISAEDIAALLEMKAIREVEQ